MIEIAEDFVSTVNMILSVPQAFCLQTCLQTFCRDVCMNLELLVTDGFFFAGMNARSSFVSSCILPYFQQCRYLEF